MHGMGRGWEADEPPWTRRTEILVGRTKCEGLGQETGTGETDEIHETEKGGW